MLRIKAKVWIYDGTSSRSSNAAAMKGAWHFVTIPKKESKDIKHRFGTMSRGWGSLPVMVTIGSTSWKTSIFPDKRAGGYLLPVKAEVRKKEKIEIGEIILLQLKLIL